MQWETQRNVSTGNNEKRVVQDSQTFPHDYNKGFAGFKRLFRLSPGIRLSPEINYPFEITIP